MENETGKQDERLQVLTLERDLARAQAEALKTQNDILRQQIRAFRSRIERFLRDGK